MTKNYSENEDEEEKESFREMEDHEHVTKLHVHSCIRNENYIEEDEIYKIRQRLDGGVIVVVVEKKYTK